MAVIKDLGLSREIKKINISDEREAGRYSFNSFFAGIGGFDLAFERAGIHPAFHCEINKFCSSVLKKHWPSLPRHEDITTLNHSNVPDVEVWCGGFPCQDVSVARGAQGRDGLKGKNSGLFYPFLDLIQEKKPQVVLLENVAGLLNSHNGHDFKTILLSLTGLGYGVSWRIINARYFGAPQSRPRVFICAWRGRVDLAINALYEEGKSPTVENARKGFVTPEKCRKTGAVVPSVGYCLSATSGRHTGTDWSRTYVSYHDKVRRLTPLECEGLQGFPVGWTLLPSDCAANDDEIDSHRYHAIGNAVCVPVVEWIGHRIVSGLSRSEGRNFSKYPSSAVPEAIRETYSCFNNALLMPMAEIDMINGEDEEIKWESGGAAFDEWILKEKVSPAPNNPIERKLIDIIEKNEVDEKYFLSPNAAKGILRRVESQNRKLFDPLYQALLRLSKQDEKFKKLDLNYCCDCRGIEIKAVRV